MPEPLKNMYHEPFLRQFALLVRTRYPAFDTDQFVCLVLGPGWDELELKGRMRRITESLGAVLPSEYEHALDILESIAHECRGFAYMFFPDFVERYGLDHWERSVAALEKLTPMSSSEFAVRPFLLRDQNRMMAQMREWSGHPDEHVRRLASEGCRPRLPWAVALPALKRDPSPIWPILEKLQADPSEYVRRSAANNLNLRMPAGEPVKLRLELAVTFPRPGGKSYRKLFKLSEKVVAGGVRVEGGRRHSFAHLSTRRHYPGIHRMALLVNGRETASVEAVLNP